VGKSNLVTNLYLAVVSQDEKGETVVRINNYQGNVTPAAKVMFGPKDPVNVVLVLEIKNKLYWRRPRYHTKDLTIETLATPATFAVAANLLNPIASASPVPEARMTWYRVVPFMEHPDGRCNDPYRTLPDQRDRRYYTNVYIESYDAHGVDVSPNFDPAHRPGPTRYHEGSALGGAGTFGKIPGSSGLDIIEYQHQIIGTERSQVWEIDADKDPGTYRYAVSFFYTPSGAKQELTLHTRGCPLDPDHKANAVEKVTHLRSADYNAGISRKVTRVLRKGQRPEPYLAALEVFNNVPWIFGSSGDQTEHQTERLIGFDCADLLVGVARLVGLTKCNYVYADLLARSGHDNTGKRTTTPRVTKEILVRCPDPLAQNPKDSPPAPLTYVSDKSVVHLKFGVDIFEGDLIFCEWQNDGKKYDHSTIIWEAGGDELSLATVVKCAHWEKGTSIKAESLQDFGETYRIRIAHW